jgi:hypothetical protein
MHGLNAENKNETMMVRQETMVRPRIALEQQTQQSVRGRAGKDEQPELDLARLEL